MEQKNLDQIIRETVARYMKHSLIVAGNWKMNMTVREGMEFLEKLGPVEREGDDFSTVYNTGSSCRRVPQERNYLWAAEFPL